MTTASATQVRGNFSDVLGRVAYAKERVTIERRGRPVAVLVPIEDLARLESVTDNGPSAEDLLRAHGMNLPGTLYRRSLHPDGRTTYDYLSSGLRDTFGLDPEAVMSRPETLTDTIHPEDRERRLQAVAESARNLGTYDVEYRCITPQGNIKWLHAISRPRRHDDGVITWTGVVLDITKWKRTEAALRESEAQLRQAAEMSNLGHWVWDEVEDRCLSCSETLARMNGVTIEEFYEKYRTMEALLADVHPDDRVRYEQTIVAARKEARSYDVEFRDAAPEGGYRYVRERSEPILDSSGRLIRSVGTLQDITEYKQTEEALRQSEARLRDLIEGSIEGILIHRNFKPLLVNGTWAAIHGYTVDEILAIESVVDLISPIDRERLAGYRETRLRGEAAPERYEYRALRKDGSEIWLEHLVRVVDWEGAPAIQTVVIDITERKSAEAALEQARNELERRVEERTRELHATNRALEEEVGTRKAVEERLSESESDLLNLIEGSVQGVVIVAEDRAPRFANQACAEIFGYDSPGDILALESTLPMIAPHEVARLDQLRKPQFAADETPASYEFDGVRKDGATIRLQCMARTMTWKGERVAQITLYDITELKRAERALRESEERYRELFDESPVAIWVEDWSPVKRMLDDLARDGVKDWRGYFDSHRDQLKTAYDLAEILDISRATIELYGKESKEHLLQMSAGAVVIDEELDAFLDMTLSFLAGLTTVEIESKDTVGDGSEIIVRRRMVMPPKYRDDWSRVIYAIEDITERRKAEETLQTRDSWLRGILENAPLQIVLKDTEGQIMAISRNTGEMLGVTMDEFPGRTTADFLPEDVAEIYMATDREVVETGRAIQQEVVEDWDGTTRHFMSSKFPLRDDGGQIVGVCSLTSDITEAKLAEERLRQAQKMEAVGQLTGGVAHDFNNLLAVIVGNGELLGDRLGPDDRQVAAVLRAAERGAELTQRLLAFSRRQPLKPQAIDLADRVAGMTELLARTLGATIEISVSPSPGLWQASADPGQLENALLNLAINARDAMPEGGRLSIATANANLDTDAIEAAAAHGNEPSGVAPGDYVVLAVSDTGSGMSPEVLARVFEPFFTTKDVGEGSGLGLSMVYGFARQSGGFAAIESEEGYGTTVRLYLPRAVEAAVQPGDRASTLEPEAPRGRGETVLVLEDTRDVRELSIVMLENLGYRVLAAAEANEADALFAKHPEVELLLTDVILPGGRSGPDFAETAHRKNPKLKILFMSGYPSEALMQRGDGLIQDIPLITKPFRKAELAKAVREVLDRRDHG